ncbi:hypothetical protein [Nocardia transvalensis]|uniref:hypothetical protein n=1 Tax=Nocardia transvalensis TaxID=37333 RepID=UPI00189370A8|nr:hypothetical protein [Nocardia transvalensis]MBF6333528.1 hypothetical protein [Nocardia transvalensis]
MELPDSAGPSVGIRQPADHGPARRIPEASVVTGTEPVTAAWARRSIPVPMPGDHPCRPAATASQPERALRRDRTPRLEWPTPATGRPVADHHWVLSPTTRPAAARGASTASTLPAVCRRPVVRWPLRRRT